MRPVLCGLSALLVLSPAPLSAQRVGANVETPAERSQSEAKTILRRAADALGGAEALMAIKAIKVTVKGKSTPRLQSSSPEPPYADSVNESDLLLDLENKKLSLQSMDNEGGVLRRALTLIGSGEPRIYNLHARTFRPFTAPPSFERELAVHSRRTPQLLLRSALASQSQLRKLAETTLENRVHDVISFTMTDGVQVAVYVDRASGLVSKLDTLYFDILTGDEAAETIFAGYTQEGVARYAKALRVREAGEETLRADFSVEINPALTDRSFDFDAAGFMQVRPSQPYPERIEELAKGIYVLHSVSDPQHNALAVEFDSYIVAIDAPDSSAGGERLIRRINALIPGKPIRFVALTHHHADHIGGLRSFIASGARVVTTPGNRKIVEAFAAAPHEDRLTASPVPLQLEIVQNGKLVLSDGKRTLELIDLGPNPHAREMLIAYLPQERIVYQSDAFIIPSNEAPVGPAPSSFVGFARAIERLGLDVQRIAGGHGRTATIEEFRERIAVRAPGT